MCNVIPTTPDTIDIVCYVVVYTNWARRSVFPFFSFLIWILASLYNKHTFVVFRSPRSHINLWLILVTRRRQAVVTEKSVLFIPREHHSCFSEMFKSRIRSLVVIHSVHVYSVAVNTMYFIPYPCEFIFVRHQSLM